MKYLQWLKTLATFNKFEYEKQMEFLKALDLFGWPHIYIPPGALWPKTNSSNVQQPSSIF